MQYSETKEIIHSTKILSDADTQFLDANIAELQHTWEKRQKFRTEVEARVSVLNDLKFPTAASKYWQAVREQSGMYSSLVELSWDYRRNKIKQTKLRRKISKCSGDLKLAGLEIDLEEAQFNQLNMEQQAVDRVRELRMWSKLMAEAVDADPKFDTEDVEQSQLAGYRLRWEAQADMLDNASPSERANLIGQLDSARREMAGEGMLRGSVKTLEQQHASAVHTLTASFDVQHG
jgi:hypothetical protein